MARPRKKGLDYFNIDVLFNANMDYVQAMHGIESLGVIIKLWQRIYGGEGYYIYWDNRIELIFCKQNGIDKDSVNAIISTCFDCGIFDYQMFLENKILTSKSIQKRYTKIVKEAKRVGCEIAEPYNILVVSSEETQAKKEFLPKKPRRNPEEKAVSPLNNTEESTQSKVKESKVKEISSSTAREENFKLVKEVKNGIPPNSAAPPLVGVDFKKELEADQVFIDKTCMVYKLTKTQFWEKHLFFIAQNLALGKLTHSSYTDFKKHFFYWIPKNKNAQTPPKKKEKATLVSMDNSKIIDASKYDKYKY